MTKPGVSREELDRELKNQSDKNARLAQALLEMDTHPGHQLLRDTELSGLTLKKWTAASADMAVLWAQFDAHRKLVEQAQHIRDRRHRLSPEDLSELTMLLTWTIVELDRDRLPIERGGPGLVAEMITVPELLRRMSKSYAQIIDLLTTADENWSELAGKLNPLEAELRTSQQLAVSVNANRNRVDRIATELAAIRQLALSDPVSADAKKLAALATDLRAVRAELDELAAVRDTFEARLARLAGQLADLTQAQRQTAEVATLVLAKIANPGLPNLDDLAADLRLQLDKLRESSRSGRWQQLAAAAEQLESEVVTATTGVRAAESALTGLLDRRAELRGRLDAYQAKARQVGYAEDLELSALHKAAHDLLFTAPCDLPASTVAVNHYRQAITERTTKPTTVVPNGRRLADSDEKESR